VLALNKRRLTLKSMVRGGNLPLTLLMVVGLAAVAISSVHPSPARVSAATGVQLNGHTIGEVSFDGTLESLQHYYGVDEAASAASGKAAHLIMDQSAVARGYFMAFTDPAAAQTYMTAHGLGTDLTGTVKAAGLTSSRRVQTIGASSLGGQPISLVTCTLTTYVSMWKNASCGGQLLDMVANDAISNFNDYGFNDAMSSAEVGYCVSNLSLWVNSNYAGSETTLGGGDYYSVMPTGFNDNISSAKTDSSGAC
jgi:hypothetical protein